MTRLSADTRSSRVRLAARGDSGFTLVESLVTLLLTVMLMGAVIAPLITVTNVSSSTQSTSQATASARAAFQDMTAGVTSASQICLPTQLTATQSVTPGNAVRVKTHVFGVDEWEQWWVDPSTNRLLAQTWTTVAPSSTSWRTVANNISPVSPPPTPAPAPFTITPTSGRISTTGALAANSYTATGTTGDVNGDTGTWTYTLHVYTPTAGILSQTEPTSGNVTASGSAAFTDQFAVAGSSGAVTYTKTGGSANLTVATSGKVTTTGALAVGSYTASGTDGDVSGDTGTWTYTLNVSTPTAGTIVQTSPTSGTVTTTGATAFTDQFAVTGNVGTVTYTQSTGSSSLTINSLPATNQPVVLSIAMTAASGTKSTAVSVPLRVAITALNTVYATGPGTCLAGLG
jgi:Tfp pilus assembly protein PilV